MQVIVSGDAAVYMLDSETEITDAAELRKLDRLDYSTDRCANYLDESLLDIGVNAQDRVKYNEGTVLMYAQKLRLVELLLKHGADSSICNAQGENAAEYALVNRHLRGYKQLSELMRSYLHKNRGSG
jgi:ankyrin repeat protein